MDESALKTLLDNLEISRSSLHGWLHFWTFLVVVGVALEVVFVVWEYTEDIHDFRRGIVHPPEKPSALLLVLGLLGAGLVAIGVAGELYIDVQAGKVETEIRKANELRVSLLSKEAADANERAAEIEQRLADRHITLEQRKKMLAILAPYRDARVSVTFVTPSSSDAQAYSIEIGEVFRDAKWTVVPSPWLTSMDNPVHGFAVVIREKGSASKRKSLERATREALSILDNRISVTQGGRDPGPEMNLDLEVLVGSK
jgi:hypothetical protein